jgi:hypothetical protein
MIKVHQLLKTDKAVFASDSSTDFEKKFISSLFNNAHKYSKEIIFDCIDHPSNREYELNFSEKQLEIYYAIEQKYNNEYTTGDIYDRYTDIFKEKGIILDSFDLRHLETFKGIMIESDNFKKWLSQIIVT